ncbi:FAD-dependent monooxygenase [Actinocrispum sp. NPDC049592]|uniref:FAD-dependent monooxygenase n=1 Tax=Actinocrispum sp. NPDC049592 TaxID=3154835 RepID=UPI0034259F37
MKILISGASVAGPALAYWLRRYGFQPTVVERAPAPRPGGYAVDFRGASMDALSRMGILDEVRRAATDMGDMEYVNERGKRIATTPPVVFSGELEVLRGDLVNILYNRTREDVEYIFDDTITSIAEDGHGVKVTFQNAAPRAFDLVIGADGLHSKVRELMFGGEERFIKHLGLYASVFTAGNHLGLDHKGRFYNSPGRTAGMYPARNNTEAKAMFYFASDQLDYGRRDTGRQKQLLRQAFADEGWEIPRLLNEMDRAGDFFFDSVSQIHMDHFTSGRTALVGDAGYCASPMSGMGTSLALVGAYVLAGELKAANGDHRIAFPRYEQEMRPFIESCWKQAEDGQAFFVPRTNRMIKLRNLSYRMLRYPPMRGIFTKMALKAANIIKLKDY